MVDQGTKDFFAGHCSTPDGIVLVHIGDGDVAVFSTLSKAHEWADRQERGDCIFVPYIIDEPDYGNIPAGKQH